MSWLQLREGLMTQVGWGKFALRERWKAFDVHKYRQAGRKRRRRRKTDGWTLARPCITVIQQQTVQTNYNANYKYMILRLDKVCEAHVFVHVCVYTGVSSAITCGVYLCPAGSVVPYGPQTIFLKQHKLNPSLTHLDTPTHTDSDSKTHTVGSHINADMCP